MARIVSLKQTSYFVAVASNGSFTAAAQSLNVSQSALSLQIKQLEERIGTQLLVRQARGVTLTEAGEAYYGFASKALALIERGEEKAAELGTGQVAKLVIGVTPTAGKALLPDLIDDMSRGKSKIVFDLHEMNSVASLRAVREGKLDLALCFNASDSADIEAFPLFREQMFLIGPPGFKWAGRSNISFADLASVPLVLGYPGGTLRDLIDQHARELGITLDVRLEMEFLALKREFLLKYDYWAVSPLGLFMPDISAGNLMAMKIHAPSLELITTLAVSRKIDLETKESVVKLLQKYVSRQIATKAMGWHKV